MMEAAYKLWGLYLTSEWKTQLWHRRTVNCEMQQAGAPYDLNILQPDVTAKLFILTISFSKRLMHLAIAHCWTLKRFQPKAAELDPICSIFFLYWSHEISAVVKDEVTYDDAIVPTYNNDIIVYVKYNSQLNFNIICIHTVITAIYLFTGQAVLLSCQGKKLHRDFASV